MRKIPLFSQQAIVNGKVAEELAVPNATIIASAIAVYNIKIGTFEKVFKNIGYTIKNWIPNAINKTIKYFEILSLYIKEDKPDSIKENITKKVIKKWKYNPSKLESIILHYLLRN